jgi:hypothetical protein
LEQAVTWSIKFHRLSENLGVSIVFSGEFWARRRTLEPLDEPLSITWLKEEGDLTADIPASHARDDTLFITAVAHPPGKKAHIKIRWAGGQRHDMEFDIASFSAVPR